MFGIEEQMVRDLGSYMRSYIGWEPLTGTEVLVFMAGEIVEEVEESRGLWSGPS
jgi:hypothetical protein